MQTATKIGLPDFQPIFIGLYCCQNAFASGALSRTPPGGFQLPQLANVGFHHCRGPHRIAGPRAPRLHDPPLVILAQILKLYAWEPYFQCRIILTSCCSDAGIEAVRGGALLPVQVYSNSLLL